MSTVSNVPNINIYYGQPDAANDSKSTSASNQDGQLQQLMQMLQMMTMMSMLSASMNRLAQPAQEEVPDNNFSNLLRSILNAVGSGNGGGSVTKDATTDNGVKEDKTPAQVKDAGTEKDKTEVTDKKPEPGLSDVIKPFPNEIPQPVECHGPPKDIPAAAPKKFAEQTLLDNFDNLKGPDNLISMQTIAEVAKGMDMPKNGKPSAELQEACQALINNPTAFKTIETSDNPEAPADMKIGEGDLRAVLHATKMGSEQTIMDNFYKLKGENGMISLQTLVNAAAGEKLPDNSYPDAKLQAAAQDMIKNPEKFVQAETIQSAFRTPDMILSKEDLALSLEWSTPRGDSAASVAEEAVASIREKAKAFAGVISEAGALNGSSGKIQAE